jgi:hypothetical protein
VISFGPVETCNVEQVKGVTYSLQGFLGEPTWSGKLSHIYSNHTNKDIGKIVFGNYTLNQKYALKRKY